jgi:AcrR family transcriptional regulator
MDEGQVDPRLRRRPAGGGTKKSARTRVRILDAAAAMFRRKGYAATTLNDIGKLARMRAASIYYHFASKEQILAEVLDIGIDRIHDAVRCRVDAMPAEASHRQRLRMAVEVHLATLLQHSDYTAANIINYGLSPADVRARHHTRREAYGDCWRQLLGDAQAAGEIAAEVDLSLLRLFLIGALNWSHEWYRPGSKSPAAMADEICAIVFDGVVAA